MAYLPDINEIGLFDWLLVLAYIEQYEQGQTVATEHVACLEFLTIFI